MCCYTHNHDARTHSTPYTFTHAQVLVDNPVLGQSATLLQREEVSHHHWPPHQVIVFVPFLRGKVSRIHLEGTDGRTDGQTDSRWTKESLPAQPSEFPKKKNKR